MYFLKLRRSASTGKMSGRMGENSCGVHAAGPRLFGVCNMQKAYIAAALIGGNHLLYIITILHDEEMIADLVYAEKSSGSIT